jgi:hypothetical protein
MEIFSDPVILDDLEIEIEEDQIIRFLRSKDIQDKHRSIKVGEAVEVAMERAEELIEPRGIYTVVPGKALPGSKIFADREKMAFCVCTIGPRLENRVAELFSHDELLEAVVLDTAGSVAAEATAEYIDRLISRKASREGLKTSRRASPGYGKWDVSEQRAIFELLPADEIGVRLTERCMMIPRKSVSFAMHIAKEPYSLRSNGS